MKDLFIVGVVVAFAYIFLPDVFSLKNIRSAAGPDHHEFLSFSEFKEKYGTRAEKEEVAKERRERIEKATRERAEEKAKEEESAKPSYTY